MNTFLGRFVMGAKPVNGHDERLWKLVMEDLRRHDSFLAPGFQALAVYRFGSRMRDGGAIARSLGKVAYYLSSWLIRVLYGIEIPSTAKMGRRIHIAHQNGVVINPKAEIGDDCLILHNVTIGERFQRPGVPRIGKGVKIGAGAVIVGGITVGDGAVIGANTVVSFDVPAGAKVVNPPPHVIEASTTKADEEIGSVEVKARN